MDCAGRATAANCGTRPEAKQSIRTAMDTVRRVMARIIRLFQQVSSGMCVLYAYRVQDWGSRPGDGVAPSRFGKPAVVAIRSDPLNPRFQCQSGEVGVQYKFAFDSPSGVNENVHVD